MAAKPRPGSFAAFLLAAHTGTSIEAEKVRARGGGLALSAVESVLRRLTVEGYLETVGITPKGLRYLQKHGWVDKPD